jgi:hypothetical protein
MTRAIAVALAVLAVAAYGGGAPAETPEASDTAVERYVSLVADHDGEWRASVSEVDHACADSSDQARGLHAGRILGCFRPAGRCGHDHRKERL